MKNSIANMRVFSWAFFFFTTLATFMNGQNKQTDENFWGGFSAYGTPVTNHFIPGVSFGLEYYYTNRFAIGGGFSIANKKMPFDGFHYKHPNLSLGNIVIINRLRIINKSNFQTSLFLKSGFGFVEISDNKAGVLDYLFEPKHHQNRSDSARANNYIDLQPGIAFAYKIGKPEEMKNRTFRSTFLTLEISYRYLNGASSFGNSAYFSGLELALGIYFNN